MNVHWSALHNEFFEGGFVSRQWGLSMSEVWVQAKDCAPKAARTLSSVCKREMQEKKVPWKGDRDGRTTALQLHISPAADPHLAICLTTEDFL